MIHAAIGNIRKRALGQLTAATRAGRPRGLAFSQMPRLGFPAVRFSVKESAQPSHRRIRRKGFPSGFQFLSHDQASAGTVCQLLSHLRQRSHLADPKTSNESGPIRKFGRRVTLQRRYSGRWRTVQEAPFTVCGFEEVAVEVLLASAVRIRGGSRHIWLDGVEAVCCPVRGLPSAPGLPFRRLRGNSSKLENRFGLFAQLPIGSATKVGEALYVTVASIALTHIGSLFGTIAATAATGVGAVHRRLGATTCLEPVNQGANAGQPFRCVNVNRA